ncbi:hypothetical protein [Arthrobacter sp. KNU40]|uniref:hypothetical protein n=1 Tax=Arthrobacter sp. KNU40 TaxID=3447965 RepID=UPI003F63D52B
MAKANNSTKEESQDKQLFYLPVEGVTVEAKDLEEARSLAAEAVEARKDVEVGDDSI